MSLITVFPMSGPNELDPTMFHYPKPLIDIGGTTMLDQAIRSFIGVADEFHFAVNELDIVKHHIDLVIRNSVSDKPVDITSIKSQTSGALSTALLMCSAYENGTELLVANYDQALGFSVATPLEFFRSKSADFGCISFKSSHPKWSFVELDEYGHVCRTAEKVPISKDALVGIYYFKDVEYFRRASKELIYNSPRSKRNYYVSEVFNQLVLHGKMGVSFSINASDYVKFYDSSVINSFSVSTSTARRNIRSFADFFFGKSPHLSPDVTESSVLFSYGSITKAIRQQEISASLSLDLGGTDNYVLNEIIVEGNKGVATLDIVEIDAEFKRIILYVVLTDRGKISAVHVYRNSGYVKL